MLSVQIRKTLGAFRLDVSFETDTEVMALLGASGCGKSMTLKCIAGIERPDEGRIVLNGRVLFDSAQHIDLPPQKRRVGYLFQQYALFPNMTVEQNIAAGCRIADKTEKRAAVAQKVHAMHLEGLEQKRPHQLSGGQQQRVALARILINEPELLLLDEPFTALDSYLKWQLELELADTLREFGRGALFVSHSRDEVYRLCQSVCVLTEGSAEPKQSVKALFEAPKTRAACLLSGCKNVSRARKVSETQVEALDWGITLAAPVAGLQQIAYVGVRAHYLRLCTTAQEPNSFLCSVDRVVEDVFSTVIMLRPVGGTAASPLRAELGKEDWKQLCSHDKLYVSVEPQNVLLLHS